MIRTLVIIAVASFVLALGCFAGVVVVGGRDLAANGWVWPEKWRNIGVYTNGPSPGARTPDEVRDIPWSGSDTLQIDLPADVNYVQGERPEVRVEGPAELIQYITVEDGRLFLTQDSVDKSLGQMDDLEITIITPSVRKFVVNGSPKLSVTNFDQENLTVEINGSGNVVVEGRTDRLAATVSGSGSADLQALNVSDANMKIVGSGEVRAGPTGKVQVSIAGSGDVHLLQRPASLESDVAGSGEVHEAN